MLSADPDLASVRSAAQDAGQNRRRRSDCQKPSANQKIHHKTLPGACQTRPSSGALCLSGSSCGNGIGRESENGMATRWERGGPLVTGKSAFFGGGHFRASCRGTTAVVACRNQREGAVDRRTTGKPVSNGNPAERVAYASSSISRCGMEATIAGQATMATNARATKMSCISYSFREDSSTLS
jgi:hypothetical protein